MTREPEKGVKRGPYKAAKNGRKKRGATGELPPGKTGDEVARKDGSDPQPVVAHAVTFQQEDGDWFTSLVLRHMEWWFARHVEDDPQMEPRVVRVMIEGAEPDDVRLFTLDKEGEVEEHEMFVEYDDLGRYTARFVMLRRIVFKEGES